MPEVTETQIALYAVPPTSSTQSSASSPSLLPPPPVTLRDVVRILRRRALLALVTFIVVVAATLLATSRMPTIYEARARILVDIPGSSSSAGDLLGILNLGGLGGGKSGTLEVEIEKMRSRGFLEQVIAAAKLPNVSPEELKNKITFSAGAGGQILEITVRAGTPDEAQHIANTTATVYGEYARNEFNNKTELDKERLKSARANALLEKNLAESKLTAFTRTAGLAEPGYYYEQRSRKTVEIKATLDEARRSLPVLEAELRFRRQQIASIPPTVITGYPLNKNEIIDRYNAQIFELHSKRKLLLLDYQPTADEVTEVDENIKTLQAQKKEAEKSAYTVGSKGVG